MKTKIYVVEDRAIAKVSLIDLLEKKDFEVVGSAATAEKAWQEIQNLRIDLVILDINLKGENNGVWLAENIRKNLNMAIIVLIDNGDKTTVENIVSINPNGFLIKPVAQSSLTTTIDIALKSFQRNFNIEKEESLFTIIENKSLKEKIYLKEIFYIKSDGNYIEVHLANRFFTLRTKLQDFLDSLPENDFLKRVHLRFAVNTHHIQTLRKSFIIINDIVIPISKSYDHTIFLK